MVILRGDGTILYESGLGRLMKSDQSMESCAIDDVLRLGDHSFWDLILERFSSFDFIVNEPAYLAQANGKEEMVYVSAKAVPEADGLSHRIACRLNLQPVAGPQEETQKATPEERQRLEMLRLANVARSHVTLSHELRNPLSVVAWSAQALQARLAQSTMAAPERERMLKDLGRVLNAATHMAKIIGSVYAAAEKREPGELAIVPVEALIKQTLDWYQPFIASTGIKVKVDLNDADKAVRCHSHQIVQVLTNLLMNARDAVLDTEGGIIELATRSHAGFIEISISDNASAQGSSSCQKPLTRVGRPEKVGRLSLGLSICEDLIERHGGHFYRDRMAIQTRFVLLLPIAAPT